MFRFEKGDFLFRIRPLCFLFFRLLIGQSSSGLDCDYLGRRGTTGGIQAVSTQEFKAVRIHFLIRAGDKVNELNIRRHFQLQKFSTVAIR